MKERSFATLRMTTSISCHSERSEESLIDLFGFHCDLLILAKEKTADLILADDTRVIREVKEKGISFATITSILLEAKRRKLLASVKEVMDEMRRQGVGINDNTYEETLRQAGEIT